MAKTRRHMAEELFQEVADLPPEMREAFLDEQCGADPSVRQEVERLVERFEKPTLESLKALEAIDEEAAQNLEGERIGPYRLLQLIGEGGFGAVYMAEQEEPIRRRVALKIIKLGMDTRQVIARFEAERQALAMMDHAGIATVYDAGATETGRPYFVMELVKGVPITEFCDANRLSTRRRLELFIQVCRAVQHAHQKGIIHRDLKPSNILVTMHDGVAVPKVIDFGIARATDQPLTDKTLFTRFGQFVGTPQYMSPEQAAISGLDIDTRSDIYSLGVLLYELLTGTTPFDAKVGMVEMQRILREEEPLTPSNRMSTLGEEMSSVAMARQAEPGTLRRQLHGELDWIVMKALDKDRARRFDTAADLAADVKRHLAGEPVLAGPPSRIYLLRKTVARHRTAFGFLVILFLLITGFGIWMGFLYAEANRLRRQAELEQQLARDAEERAVKEAETSSRVSDFLVDLFNVSDPLLKQGDSITAREILDRGAERIHVDLEGQPAIRAEMLFTMGRVYANLGLLNSAVPLLEDTVELRTGELGEAHPDTLKAAILLGRLYRDQGRLPEAESLLGRALETSRRALGNDDRTTLKAMKYLCWVLQRQNKFDEAEPLCREALEISRRTLATNDPDTLGAMQTLAWQLQAQGHFDEAEPLCREALAISRHIHGDRELGTASSLDSLAAVLQASGKDEEAVPLFREALEIRRSVLGEDHLRTTNSKINLAEILHRFGSLSEAEALYRQGLEANRSHYGNRHRRTLNSLVNLGRLLVEMEEAARAEPYLLEALAGLRILLGDEHPHAYNLMPFVADVLVTQEKYEEAKSLLHDYLEIRARVSPGEDGALAVARSLLGACMTHVGRFDEAEALLEESLPVIEREIGKDHVEARKAALRLEALREARDNESSEKLR